MAKKNTVKTVRINVDLTKSLISDHGWSNAYFSTTLMGKVRGWVSEWIRGKNFPTPEEAAKMCILLGTTPGEILLGVGDTPEDTQKLQDDISLVKSLVEQENEKKAPDPQIEGDARKIIDFVRSASEEEMSEIENFVAYLESKRKKE